MSQIDPPVPGTEHGLNVDPETTWSPKAIAAGVASFVAPAILATIAYIVSNPDSLPIHQPILGVLVFAVLTSASTTIAAYLKRDPLRNG